MALTAKQAVEMAMDEKNKMRINDDFDRFLVFNGKLKEIIKQAIAREFALPETIRGLSDRIIPINITQKIINKLAMVYMQPPVREPSNGNPGDQELLDQHSRSMKMNRKGKLANRYFKLHKHTAWEPYLDRQGIPRLRTIPSHTYTPISDDKREPEKPTIFLKHLKIDTDAKNSRFAYWTDERFLILNGNGAVMGDEMNALNNPKGVNPFGVIPFTYISEEEDGKTIPIPDDDLITVQIAICILLSDLSFASKYQLWSIFVCKGGKVSRKAFNPNSIINLPPGADFDAVKPDIDSDKALAMIETLLGMLLTTKNLSVGDISGMVRAEGASGIAKMLDRAETTEDRQDQQAIFIDAEKEYWDEKYAPKILPWWVKSNQINPKFAGAFSPDFELSIKFKDPKPFIGDKDKVELEETKLKAGLTTTDRALKNVHPDMDAEEIKKLKAEIEAEKKQRIKDMQANFNPGEESDGPDDEA